jgi:hypothetical protein
MYAKMTLQPPSASECVIVDTIAGTRQIVETGRDREGQLDISVYFYMAENTGDIIHDIKEFLESKGIVVS